MIKEYNLIPFRKKLWIAIDANYKDVKDNFTTEVNGEQEELTLDRWNYWNNTGVAYSVRVVKKKTRSLGYLIILLNPPSKGSDLVDCMAHEATHISDYIQEDIGCCTTDTEINAHITGYVAGKFMLTYNKIHVHR